MWTKRWGYEMATKPTRPGIYRLKDGGHFVRSRVTDRTGRRREVTAVLPEATTPQVAQRELDRLVADARDEARGVTRSSLLWSEFAASLLEERVMRGEIESAATVERWQDALDDYLVPAFGRLRAVNVDRAMIDRWLTKTVLPWMRDGRMIQRIRRKTGKPIGKPRLVVLKATTVNGILRILATICEAARIKFDLAKSAFDGIKFLPEGRVYTREQPNALAPSIVPRFLAVARAKFPQHYLMIVLGFVTGARPGEIRALRRKGPNADIDMDTGVLEIRRSHSRGAAAMDRTKTKVDRTVVLPPTLLDEVRRHVDALPEGAAQKSDLLFPTKRGGLRTRNLLAKPFKAIVNELGLKMRVTPRAMRRTFNDLAREVGLEAVVQRSISGHMTEEMRHHYSTARDAEKRDALGKVHEKASRIENQPPTKGGIKGERPSDDRV